MSSPFLPSTLTIATRQSRLALWQARAVAQAIEKHYPRCRVNFLPLSTKGDEVLDRSLALIGGKGLFIKELEHALQDGRADLAVHSAKDVPMNESSEWAFMPLLPRAEVRDALIFPHLPPSNNPINPTNPIAPDDALECLRALPRGSVLGTSSARRQSIVQSLFPHLVVRNLRGNLDTRLQKLDQGGPYQAIVLAAAGLHRLSLDARLSCLLPLDPFLPAVGQGALIVETRANKHSLLDFLRPLQDAACTRAVLLERALGLQLAGNGGLNCQTPLAIHAQALPDGAGFYLRAQIFSREGRRLFAAIEGQWEQREAALSALAASLQAQGLAEVLGAWQQCKRS